MKKRLTVLLLIVTLILSSLSASVWAAEGEKDLFSSLSEWYGEDWLNEFVDYFAYHRIPEEWITERLRFHYDEILSDPVAAITESGWDEEELRESLQEGYFDGSMDYFYAVQAYQRTWDDAYDYDPPVAVQFNGNILSFPDAEPEITAEGRTVVPFRTAAEEMGYTVSFDAGAVVAANEERSLAFVIGEPICYVTSEGETSEIDMDTAPYIEGDRTYVPVRFLAEAFGKTVEWDEEQKLVVIYDREEVISDFDRDFTVVNQWIKARAKEEPATVSMDMDIHVTEFSTLDGNREYPIAVSAQVSTDGKNIDAEIALDAKDFIRSLMEEEGGDSFDEAEALLVDALLAKPLALQWIWNFDAKESYVRVPALLLFSLYDWNELPASDACWIKVDLNEIYEEAGIDIAGEWEKIAADQEKIGESLGNLVVWLIESNTGAYAKADRFEKIETAHTLLADIIGDACFSGKNEKKTTSFDIEKEDETLAPDWKDLFYSIDAKYLKGDLTLNTKSGDLSLEIEAREEGWDGGDTLYSVSLTETGGDVIMNVTIHQDNQFLMDILSKSAKSPLSGNIRQAPPEGETVLTLNELFGIIEDMGDHENEAETAYR